jgi:hypothetical protein
VRRLRSACCALVGAAWLALAAPAHAVLGLGVNTPTVAMNLTPGATASGSGVVIVTPGLGTWQLSISDTSGNNGHLKPAAIGCSGAQPLTTNPLTAQATDLLLGNNSDGPVTVAATPKRIASGVLGDTLTVQFSLPLPNTERMPAGCLFSTTLTYTLQ